MGAGAFPRFARRQDLGLGVRDFERLLRLDSPQRIQAFLNAMPINHELDGETVHSVKNVLRHRRAHCIEGAFLAACALWIHGEPPLVMHLDCALSDYPHVIALYRRHGAWGAISKTNAVFLRFRDPVYRTLRELALSYFHEYSDKRGLRTLRSYSGAFDLRRIDLGDWVSNDENCWPAHDRLAGLRHYPLVKPRVVPHLSRRDPFEQKVAGAVQYPKPKAKVAARKRVSAELPRPAGKRASEELPRPAGKRVAAELPRLAGKRVAAELPRLAGKRVAAELPRPARKRASAELPRPVEKRASMELPRPAGKRRAG